MSLIVRDHRPAVCTQHTQQDVELEWTAAADYPAGAELELRARRMRDWYFWKFVRSDMDDAEITWRWLVYPQLPDMAGNPDRIIFKARLRGEAKRGSSRRIRLTLIPPYLDSVDLGLSIWVRRDGSDLRDEPGTSCVIGLTAAAVERFVAWCAPMPGADGRVRARLSPQDRFGNPARFANPVTVELAWQDRTWTEPLTGSRTIELPAPAAPERLTVRVPMTALALTENIANARRDGDHLAITGNPVWPAAAGPRAAFGEVHWHTELSGDGHGPIELALRHARDQMNLDFAAPSDHSPVGEKWTQTVAAVEAANEPDRFATLFGWENSTAHGHENFYFTDPDHPLRPGGKYRVGYAVGGRPGAGTVRDEERPDYVREPGVLCVPHHTNAVSESRRPDGSPVWNPYPWASPEPAVRLVEIMQLRGNQERNAYRDVWHGWHQHNGASVQDALSRGHQLGFTGGTDNHMAWPGRAWEPAEVLLGGNIAHTTTCVTGVWTERIERQAVFDALWARHTWASWCTRAIVWFTVNDVLMGGDLEVAAGRPLRASLRLSAEDALQSVEIISETETVWGASFSDPDIETEIPLGEAVRDTHFYLRALQRDGGIIYASPVYVTVTGTGKEKTA